MLGIISSIFSGGLTGLLGVGFQRFFDFLKIKQAVHVVVVPQEVGWKFLGLCQTPVLGRNGLKFLDKSVRRRVAGEAHR